MKLFKLLLSLLTLLRVENFMIPQNMLGKWKLSNNQETIFLVDNKSIYVIHDNSNISMDFKEFQDSKMELNNFQINKKPDKIVYNNMFKIITFINSLKNNGLIVIILENKNENIKNIQFITGKFSGEFEIIKFE